MGYKLVEKIYSVSLEADAITNSILHSCCFPGLKRCQYKPFVASVIHPPLSHAPQETHGE